MYLMIFTNRGYFPTALDMYRKKWTKLQQMTPKHSNAQKDVSQWRRFFAGSLNLTFALLWCDVNEWSQEFVLRIRVYV
jgi:hypothetical protein